MSLPTNFTFWNTGFLPLGEPTGRGIARRIGVAERDGFRREILIRHGSSAAGRRTTCSLHAYRVKNAGHPVWESRAFSNAQPGNRMNQTPLLPEPGLLSSFLRCVGTRRQESRRSDGLPSNSRAQRLGRRSPPGYHSDFPTRAEFRPGPLRRSAPSDRDGQTSWRLPYLQRQIFAPPSECLLFS